MTDRLLIPTALAPEQTKSFQSYIGAQYILQKEETSMFYEFWEAGMALRGKKLLQHLLKVDIASQRFLERDRLAGPKAL